jgi:hypothetical protein
MKTAFTIIVALCISTALIAQGMQQKIDLRLDSIGNAKITVAMTMNAQQWQQWSQTLGNNPAALKREIERGMPAYFLDDFKLDKDDMNRSFSLSLNAYGVCEIDKRGRWTLKTDQKNANLTELSERSFMLVSSPPEFGGGLQQTYTVTFPETANNIKVDTDSFGETEFTFTMDNPASGGGNLLLVSGIALLAVGGVWTSGLLRKKKERHDPLKE